MRTRVLAALLLAGCASHDRMAGDRIATIPPTTDMCGARLVQDVVGKRSSDISVGDVRIRSGARAVRTIRPGMMVTMDYREDRLNLRIDSSGRIGSASCG